MAQQGSPPRRSSRSYGQGHRARPERPERAERPRRERPERPWQQFDAFAPDTDTDLPPWAGPSGYPVRAGRTRVQPPPARDYDDRGSAGPDWAEAEVASPAPGQRTGVRRYGRAAEARLRRSRRRVYRWCGIAIAVCVIGAGIAAIVIPSSAPKPLPFVTKLLPGEYKSVPDACTAVSPPVLNSYLPAGPGRTTTQSGSGASESQCSFTIDKKPTFLVLEITVQAFQPFAAATGNGSASQNALDNFLVDRQALATRAKHSPFPAAVITALSNTGQHAFSAFQPEHVSGITTDRVTVEVVERNVVITVSLQGEESGSGFNPVPTGTLQAGARAVAGSVLTKVRHQPTA